MFMVFDEVLVRDAQLVSSGLATSARADEVGLETGFDRPPEKIALRPVNSRGILFPQALRPGRRLSRAWPRSIEESRRSGERASLGEHLGSTKCPSLCLDLRPWTQTVIGGTMANVRKNELASASTTDIARLPRNSPTGPDMRINGENANIVVTVEPSKGTNRDRTLPAIADSGDAPPRKSF